MSFFAAPVEAWEEIRECLRRRGPLAEGAARTDLRYMENEARMFISSQGRMGQRWPGRSEWMARWGWGEWATRRLLERDDWQDPGRAVPIETLRSTTLRSGSRNAASGTSSTPAGIPVAASSAAVEREELPTPLPVNSASTPGGLPQARSSLNQPNHEPPSPSAACEQPAGCMDGACEGPTLATVLGDDRQGRELARRLAAVGVGCVQELTAHDWKSLRFQRGIGERNADLVKAALAQHGLSLAPDPTAPVRPSGQRASPFEDEWTGLCASPPRLPPTDSPAAAALRDIGGSSTLRARTPFDERHLRTRFLAACAEHATRRNGGT